ncbi:MAG: hypothetical protein PHR35_16745 [Kiritimatiellae bacterium]|nr:hypothetical protein [Kiritimatiellia bacterium]
MSRLRIVMLLLLLWVSACALATRLAPFQAVSGAGASPFASWLLDGVRGALSNKCMDMADRYFHMGGEHQIAEAFSDTPFQRLRDRISPRAVVHRKGSEAEEMLPWLWMSANLDSSNLEHVLTTGFWLERSGHPDQAAKFLGEAQRRIGPHPELYLARARAALALGKIAEAEELLTSGLKCSDHAGPKDTTEQSALVSRGLMSYRAYLYEMAGDTNAAIRVYRRILEEFPTRGAGLRQRLQALESGATPSPTAAELIASVLHAPILCERHAHEHDTAHPDAAQEHRHDREEH